MSSSSSSSSPVILNHFGSVKRSPIRLFQKGLFRSGWVPYFGTLDGFLLFLYSKDTDFEHSQCINFTNVVDVRPEFGELIRDESGNDCLAIRLVCGQPIPPISKNGAFISRDTSFTSNSNFSSTAPSQSSTPIPDSVVLSSSSISSSPLSPSSSSVNHSSGSSSLASLFVFPHVTVSSNSEQFPPPSLGILLYFLINGNLASLLMAKVGNPKDAVFPPIDQKSAAPDSRETTPSNSDSETTHSSISIRRRLRQSSFAASQNTTYPIAFSPLFWNFLSAEQISAL